MAPSGRPTRQDLDAGAVDQKMQRLVPVDPFRQDRQVATPAAEGRMVGNSDRRRSASPVLIAMSE